MSSIIVFIPYLFAVTLSINVSHQIIYTRLAVCKCVSFTFRLRDSPSLLMAIYVSLIHKMLVLYGSELCLQGLLAEDCKLHGIGGNGRMIIKLNNKIKLLLFHLLMFLGSLYSKQ